MKQYRIVRQIKGNKVSFVIEENRGWWIFDKWRRIDALSASWGYPDLWLFLEKAEHDTYQEARQYLEELISKPKKEIVWTA